MISFFWVFVSFSLGFREMKNGEKRQRVVLGIALLRFLGAEFIMK